MFYANNDSYSSFNVNVTGTFTTNMLIGVTVDKKFTSSYLVYKSQTQL
jgi:hypothetical protein